MAKRRPRFFRALRFAFVALVVGYILWHGLGFKAGYLQLRAYAGVSSIPCLIAESGDRSEVVRSVVISSLANFGLESLPNVVDALNVKDESTREGALMVLARMPRYHSELKKNIREACEPELRRMLASDTPRLRVQAASALVRLGITDREVEAALLAILDETDRQSCYYAFDVLGELGSEASDEVRSRLSGAANSESPIREWAREALHRIQHPEPTADR